jgi:nitrous oxidase accessory protein NosD
MRFLRSGASLAVFVSVMAAALQAQSSLTRPYASFVVTPHGSSVATGNTEQFSAVGMGNADVQWTATGGTITPTGFYMAGSTPGTYVVTAASGEWTMTVPVTVAERTPSTPRPAVPVAIDPGQSIQDAVRAHPAGTTFLIRRGVHRRQATIRPKDGMVFIGEAGAVLDGDQAPGPAFDIYQTRNVVIRGLRITRYALPQTNGAIDAGGSEGSLIEGNEIDHNANSDRSVRTYGLILGNTSVVRRNIIHHNGWLGINGFKAMDSLIESNDIYANPPEFFNDAVGEAANIKLLDCGRITIRGNHVHDGIFKGIWLDTMRPDLTIEHNRIINHGQAGIWYEISPRGVIRNNYIENAGYHQSQIRGWLRGGGIEISNSPDVSVLNNTVVNSLNGIIGLQAKSYRDSAYTKAQLRNLLVQGNRIVMPRGQTGIAEDSGSAEVFTSWNNRFVGNRFELLDNAAPFAWMGRDLDERQWQAYGQGTNDQFAR